MHVRISTDYTLRMSPHLHCDSLELFLGLGDDPCRTAESGYIVLVFPTKCARVVLQRLTEHQMPRFAPPVTLCSLTLLAFYISFECVPTHFSVISLSQLIFWSL